LDNEMTRDQFAGRGKSQNLLSDAGSKYGDDQEDRISYFQSEYSGIGHLG